MLRRLCLDFVWFILGESSSSPAGVYSWFTKLIKLLKFGLPRTCGNVFSSMWAGEVSDNWWSLFSPSAADLLEDTYFFYASSSSSSLSASIDLILALSTKSWLRDESSTFLCVNYITTKSCSNDLILLLFLNWFGVLRICCEIIWDWETAGPFIFFSFDITSPCGTVGILVMDSPYPMLYFWLAIFKVYMSAALLWCSRLNWLWLCSISFIGEEDFWYGLSYTFLSLMSAWGRSSVWIIFVFLLGFCPW